MSIALERIETSGFGRAMKCACDMSRFESTPAKERKEVVVEEEEEEEEEEEDWISSTSSTTTSSIGRNSDDVSGRSSDGGDGEENEVQSSYKGGLDMMDSLEQVLPIRRGISNFYNGKSKSFTSLAEASSTSSMKDIAKPENAYTRRRRNLLAINHVWDKNRNKRPFIRPISSSKSTLALAVAMSSSESISSTSDDSTSTSSPRLPPLHPQTRTYFNNHPSSPPPPPLSYSRNFSSWRSFSLADVREYSSVMGSANPDSSLIHDKTNS